MSDATTAMGAVAGLATAASSAAICVCLILILRPALRRYALAKPNERSSHEEPTPQGGGIAVIFATITVASLGISGLGVPVGSPLVTVWGAAIAMAGVGVTDDIRPLGVLPRLLLQAIAVAALIYALPEDLRVIAGLPKWAERTFLFFSALWLVNLVNFMDGIDWITVAEVVPITAALAVIGFLGVLSLDALVVSLALGGAMIGFSYFNRPVAKLFLGDVGSLPIGLLLGWLLALLAGRGFLTAAILLPLYYLADATLTLLRRLWNGEKFWRAHRSHFYQRATDRGLRVTEVVARVFAVNLGLAALAVVTVVFRRSTTDVVALLCGVALVGWLLNALARGRS